MADASFVVGGDDIDEKIVNEGEFAYSNFNKNGDSPSGESTTFMNKKGKVTISVGDGTMLIDTLKDGSSKVSNEISKASNEISKVVSKVDQFKNVVNAIGQITKEVNNKKIKHMKFQEDGIMNGQPITDSSGQRVKPMEAKAKKDAEYAKYKGMDNQIPYGDLIDDGDEIKDDDNIMTAVIKDIVNIDISKIQNLDNGEKHE